MNLTFSSIKDQNHIINQLKNSLINDKIKQGYMFIGKKGIGKKLTALIFSRLLLCDNNNKLKRFDMGMLNDFLAFYDTGEILKLEIIKKIIIESNHKAFEGKYKIIFIENGERMTKESSNALLKTIEETPNNIIFIMTVSEPWNIPNTLLSRMEKYYFNLLSEKTIDKIIKKEGYKENPFKIMGSIDEIKILLNSSSKEFYLFDDFVDLFFKYDLEKIFKYAEILSKNLNIKIFLSYYEKEFSRKIIENIINNKNFIIYEIFVLKIEEAIKKIKNNINIKNALECSFLEILSNMRRSFKSE